MVRSGAIVADGEVDHGSASRDRNGGHRPSAGGSWDRICEAIGDTPLVRLNRLPAEAGCQAEILVKLEFFNPLSSVKDRIAPGDDRGGRSGRASIGPDSVIVEPTSGNTGIALAFVCAAKGYRLILTMPESMSIERRKMLKLLGAELELTPAAQGMRGALARAERISPSIPDAVMLQQFENPANPEVHRRTTAEEIWRDTGGRLDAIVAGVGTGGTITGCAQALKRRAARHPRSSRSSPRTAPVLSGGKPGPHKIQGIGAGFVPANPRPQPGRRGDADRQRDRVRHGPAGGGAGRPAGRHLVRRHHRRGARGRRTAGDGGQAAGRRSSPPAPSAICRRNCLPRS